MSTDDAMRATMEQVLRAAQWRAEQPYDGVLGVLPQWVPANFHRDFEGARNKLLRNGYSPEDLRRFIDENMEMQNRSMENCDDTPVFFRLSAPVQILKEISMLARLQAAVRMGEEQGLAFLTDADHAKHVTLGKGYRQNQSSKAKRPRGAVSEEGNTIGEMVHALSISHEHQEEPTKALWPRLFAKLEEEGLNPEEAEGNGDLKKSRYWYDFNGKRKPISFGQFANLVSQSRNGKKSG